MDGRPTLGERAADQMRAKMGSWRFVFGALVFLAVWMVGNVWLHGFDPFPFILLNLVLSCLAALQGAILLISAKRADQIMSELAQRDYQHGVQDLEVDREALALLERVAERLGVEGEGNG